MSSPDPLNIDGSIMFEAFAYVLAGEVAPEDFLDGDGSPLLHILHPLFLHLHLRLCLGVLDFEVPLAVGIETQPLFAFGDFDHIGLFMLSFLLFKELTLFGV